MFSQFTYLFIPLPRPDNKVMKDIDSLTYNLLWGCRRDKISRKVIARPRDQGGLNMFKPSDFILSLKLTIISKILDPDFKHAWKEIIKNQFQFPKFPIISIENGNLGKGSGFSKDIIDSYHTWKERSTKSRNETPNLCIWRNKSIPPIGNKLWVDILIEKGVMYLSDFLNTDSRTMLYDEFLTKWSLDKTKVPEYVFDNIHSAIHRYDRKSRDVEKTSGDTSLRFFMKNGPEGNRNQKVVKGAQIRQNMQTYHCPSDLGPIIAWSNTLNKTRGLVEWGNICYNIFNITNNRKLTQFQYKFIMRISTSKYMRHKMKIETNSTCSQCNNSGVPETLDHIFIQCPRSKTFFEKLKSFIVSNFESSYIDNDNFHLITCNHDNFIVNYFNAVGKWYISRCYQMSTQISWAAFVGMVRKIQLGEKTNIRDSIMRSLP